MWHYAIVFAVKPAPPQPKPRRHWWHRRGKKK